MCGLTKEQIGAFEDMLYDVLPMCQGVYGSTSYRSYKSDHYIEEICPSDECKYQCPYNNQENCSEYKYGSYTKLLNIFSKHYNLNIVFNQYDQEFEIENNMCGLVL